MSLYFTHPIWLWGAVVVAVVLVAGRRRSLVESSSARQRFVLVARSIACGSILLALAGLAIAFVSVQRETIFLVDSSDSVAGDSRQKIDAFISEVQKNDPNRRFRTIRFAKGVDENSDAPFDAASRRETNLENALFAAFAATDPSRVSDVVLFSDGNETTGDAARAIGASRAPVSVVPLSTSEFPEVQVSEIQAPERARQGEPFRATVVVRSSVPNVGKLAFYKNGALLENRDVELEPGENRFAFEATASATDKEIELVASVEARRDQYADNNDAVRYVAADGAPRLLAVAKNPDSLRNFARALKAQNIELQARPIEGLPSDSVAMEQFDAIVLSDVPASSLSLRQMEALQEYARDFGGGFVAIGGENAFGVGGYGKTPLDVMLPVRSDFEKEKDKPSLAVALVIDRSGSMEGDKLELTKDAAKGVVELLSPRDFISVVAFDDVPHEVVPLQNATSPSAISETIGSIVAEGSTNLYPAMTKAVDDLLRVNAKFKHMIILSDGQSVPGDFDRTVRRAAGGDVTISTVAVGSDADKFLLEKIAADGSGRFYYCEDASSVPQIFARETKIADRSAIDETPFLATEAPAGSKILGSISLEFAPPLLGVDVVQAKPMSEVALETESGAPLLVFWRFGLGKTLAFASDVDGRWSAEWLDWSEFSAFWAQIARFVARQPDASGSRLDVATTDGRATLALDARNREGDYLDGAIAEIAAIDATGRKRVFETPQLAPGFYATSVPIQPGVKYGARASAVVNGDVVVSVGRVFVADKGRESDVKPVNEELLREIAEKTGGIYDPSPETLVQLASEQKTPGIKRAVPLRAWLLCVALFAFIADLYARRGVFAGRKIALK